MARATFAVVPAASPIITNMTTMMICPLMATAAKALAPNLPTQIMSTRLKAACKMLLKIIGIAKIKSPLVIEPLVRSLSC